jgi:ubiquinone/menaquinone biosynthesis C-methylase UbiE
LLALSLRFPAIRFGGVELTEAGVRTARTLAADPATAGLLQAFVDDRISDAGGPARLELRQGSAEALPLPDKSADLVMTVLALEQMERIRPAALRELARVAKRHVVMIEPFHEWNAERPYREYIRRLDYWAGAVADLPAFGLVPIAGDADLPQKLTSRVGIVVAEVR